MTNEYNEYPTNGGDDVEFLAPDELNALLFEWATDMEIPPVLDPPPVAAKMAQPKMPMVGPPILRGPPMMASAPMARTPMVCEWALDLQAKADKLRQKTGAAVRRPPVAFQEAERRDPRIPQVSKPMMALTKAPPAPKPVLKRARAPPVEVDDDSDDDEYFEDTLSKIEIPDDFDMDEVMAEVGMVYDDEKPSSKRRKILKKWKAKRATLVFGRKVKYKRRHDLAAGRKRVGGRFVKDETSGPRVNKKKAPAVATPTPPMPTVGTEFDFDLEAAGLTEADLAEFAAWDEPAAVVGMV